MEFSLKCIREYKKFIFLICSVNYPLTPSEEVDQVWHLHLLYTHSYWDEMCNHILKKQIHHGPTKGGNKEKEKYLVSYDRTLEIYTSIFKEEPPADVWPPPEVRFRRINLRKVNPDEYWVFKKPKFLRRH